MLRVSGCRARNPAALSSLFHHPILSPPLFAPASFHPYRWLAFSHHLHSQTRIWSPKTRPFVRISRIHQIKRRRDLIPRTTTRRKNPAIKSFITGTHRYQNQLVLKDREGDGGEGNGRTMMPPDHQDVRQSRQSSSLDDPLSPLPISSPNTFSSQSFSKPLSPFFFSSSPSSSSSSLPIPNPRQPSSTTAKFGTTSCATSGPCSMDETAQARSQSHHPTVPISPYLQTRCSLISDFRRAIRGTRSPVPIVSQFQPQRDGQAEIEGESESKEEAKDSEIEVPFRSFGHFSIKGGGSTIWDTERVWKCLARIREWEEGGDEISGDIQGNFGSGLSIARTRKEELEAWKKGREEEWRRTNFETRDQDDVEGEDGDGLQTLQQGFGWRFPKLRRKNSPFRWRASNNEDTQMLEDSHGHQHQDRYLQDDSTGGPSTSSPLHSSSPPLPLIPPPSSLLPPSLLLRAFRILALQRPRTRQGFKRLLIVVAMLKRAVSRSDSGSHFGSSNTITTTTGLYQMSQTTLESIYSTLVSFASNLSIRGLGFGFNFSSAFGVSSNNENDYDPMMMSFKKDGSRQAVAIEKRKIEKRCREILKGLVENVRVSEEKVRGEWRRGGRLERRMERRRNRRMKIEKMKMRMEKEVSFSLLSNEYRDKDRELLEEKLRLTPREIETARGLRAWREQLSSLMASKKVDAGLRYWTAKADEDDNINEASRDDGGVNFGKDGMDYWEKGGGEGKGGEARAIRALFERAIKWSLDDRKGYQDERTEEDGEGEKDSKEKIRDEEKEKAMSGKWSSRQEEKMPILPIGFCNQAISGLSRRGPIALEWANNLYQHMGKEVPIKDLWKPSSSSSSSLSPSGSKKEDKRTKVLLPRPDRVTRSIMIWAFCWNGDLRKALEVVREMERIEVENAQKSRNNNNTGKTEMEDRVSGRDGTWFCESEGIGGTGVGGMMVHDFIAIFKGFAKHGKRPGDDDDNALTNSSSLATSGFSHFDISGPKPLHHSTSSSFGKPHFASYILEDEEEREGQVRTRPIGIGKNWRWLEKIREKKERERLEETRRLEVIKANRKEGGGFKFGKGKERDRLGDVMRVVMESIEKKDGLTNENVQKDGQGQENNEKGGSESSSSTPKPLPWSLPILQTVFDAFMSLRPPPSHPSIFPEHHNTHSSPFSSSSTSTLTSTSLSSAFSSSLIGERKRHYLLTLARAAPTPKQTFWPMAAFLRVTGTGGWDRDGVEGMFEFEGLGLRKGEKRIATGGVRFGDDDDDEGEGEKGRGGGGNKVFPIWNGRGDANTCLEVWERMKDKFEDVEIGRRELERRLIEAECKEEEEKHRARESEEQKAIENQSNPNQPEEVIEASASDAKSSSDLSSSPSLSWPPFTTTTPLSQPDPTPIPSVRRVRKAIRTFEAEIESRGKGWNGWKVDRRLEGIVKDLKEEVERMHGGGG